MEVSRCRRGERGSPAHPRVCVYYCSTYGTLEEPGTLTQGVALFSLVPLVWNPKLQGGWCKPNHQPIGGSQPSGDLEPTQGGVCVCFITGVCVCVCVFYYCRTYYKAVRMGGGGVVENSVPHGESSLAGQWLPAAGGDGTWAAKTGSVPMRMHGDIFAASRLCRGRLLTTGHWSSSHPVVGGAGDVAWGSLRRGGRKRGSDPDADLPSACGFSEV